MQIAFILCSIWFGFWKSNLHTIPFFSIAVYKVDLLSASSSTNTNTTDSFIIFIFSSMYFANFSFSLAVSPDFFFPSFLNNPVFLAIINFFSYPKLGVSMSEIISGTFCSSIIIKFMPLTHSPNNVFIFFRLVSSKYNSSPYKRYSDWSWPDFSSFSKFSIVIAFLLSLGSCRWGQMGRF